MDPAPLTPRERRQLAAIEAELRGDRRMDRRLRTMRRRPPGSTLLARLALTAALVASVALLAVAVATASAAWVTAFAVVWPATLVLAALMLRRWGRRQR
ncbi:DUF3040 domain-containing protein [Streptomyces sp. NPDC006529]|uniref:DUF3040 domain-containing protein n=1 Tax=Streptomyces sp. NPDC006529 TaxID=3157177 RepID=UPI0033B47BA8